jgi:hypothetical protein
MKRSVFSENVFARIGVVTLASTLVLVFSLFYYLAFRVVDADNDAKAITARLTSQAVVDKIDRNFYERFGDVQAFAYNQLARQALDSRAATPAVQQFVNTMTAYYVLYDLMMICDLQGKVLVTNTTDKAGDPIDPSPAFCPQLRPYRLVQSLHHGQRPRRRRLVFGFLDQPRRGPHLRHRRLRDGLCRPHPR